MNRNLKLDYLKKICIESLEKNIVTTESGLFLRAGAHQFASFWTRDFCFASYGLNSTAHHITTKNHLQFLIDNRRKNFICRGFDIINPKFRVLEHTFYKMFPGCFEKDEDQIYKGSLHFEWLGEHGTPSMDSNLLVILSSFEYSKKTNDFEFIDKNYDVFLELVSFYETFLENNLIVQPAFSDWQDSSRREGYTFYLNLLYYVAIRQLAQYEKKDTEKLNLLKDKLDSLKINIKNTFYCNKTGIFRAVHKKDIFSLDGNLMAINFNFLDFEESKILLSKIKTFFFENRRFGICTRPNYPRKDISWTTQIVGLRNYHDNMIWSWLIGQAFQSACCLKDEVLFNEIIDFLLDMISTENIIHEIYDPISRKPYKNLLYKSESPFSWGAGQILYGIEKSLLIFN